MSTRVVLTFLLGAACAGACESRAASDQAFYAEFIDRRDPLPYKSLAVDEREAFELGLAVFNTQWVAAGTPRAQRRDGLGPVFNAASCDACHNNGARGAAPEDSGDLPASLVIQLAESGRASSRYGHVLNTVAIEGFQAEGRVRVLYEERPGRYPDGQPWSLRAPRYELYELRNGALEPGTVIKPRIAPALFGAGLLDAVPRHAGMPQGRFGWQADSPSLADQTARALSREMGLTSSLIPHADCGVRTVACLEGLSGGSPEVSEEFMHALLAFQRWLAVPRPSSNAAANAEGAALFETAGCTACHLPTLPVEGIDAMRSIDALTDLRVHDMGADLADRDTHGRPVRSLWRTAPLWGLGHPDRRGRIDSLLHDGRARSIEEAILWHGGEALPARQRFEQLSSGRRTRLLEWLAAH